ncbi:uncharacterized protein LOC141585307 [Saimiri boliviensis]|uniref:uncharacterized protein LOC141585307 n=1 Tax=Saimiri boliviensis TaxID=27679 RepID=UPI003D7843BF
MGPGLRPGKARGRAQQTSSVVPDRERLAGGGTSATGPERGRAAVPGSCSLTPAALARCPEACFISVTGELGFLFCPFVPSRGVCRGQGCQCEERTRSDRRPGGEWGREAGGPEEQAGHPCPAWEAGRASVCCCLGSRQGLGLLLPWRPVSRNSPPGIPRRPRERPFRCRNDALASGVLRFPSRALRKPPECETFVCFSSLPVLPGPFVQKDAGIPAFPPGQTVQPGLIQKRVIEVPEDRQLQNMIEVPKDRLLQNVIEVLEARWLQELDEVPGDRQLQEVDEVLADRQLQEVDAVPEDRHLKEVFEVLVDRQL